MFAYNVFVRWILVHSAH